jgi:hypothetical protein
LTYAMGAEAQRLKVLDVRDNPPALRVELAGEELEWPASTAEELVEALADAYRDAKHVRLPMVLGEWNDMLQILCARQHALAVLRGYM